MAKGGLHNMLLICLLFVLGARLTDAGHWSYDRCAGNGPKTQAWTRTDGELCDGKEGTPIDLCDAIPFPGGKAPKIRYSESWHQAYDPYIENNGHSIQLTMRGSEYPKVQTDVGNLANIIGRGKPNATQTWVLEQMHIHFGRTGKNDEGSEHFLRSKIYPLELHFVHFNSERGGTVGQAAASGESDAVMVIGIMAEIDLTEPTALTTMARNTISRAHRAGQQDIDAPFRFFDILENAGTDYFSYKGGLTTPGCNEIVTWVFLANPTTVTQETLDTFKAASTVPTPLRPHPERYPPPIPPLGLHGNYRPLAARNGRKLYSSTGENPFCQTPDDPAVCTSGYFIRADDPVADIMFLIFTVLGLGIGAQTVLEWVPPAFRVSYTLVMYLVGLFFVPIAAASSHKLTNATQNIIQVNPQIFMYLFIPPLLFSAALEIKPHTLRKQLASCTWLAGPSMVVSVCLLAVLLKPIFMSYDWNWSMCFMVASLVSAMDPSAVVALLAELGAPENFNALIEGEAILNDGTASVIFILFREQFRRDHRSVHGVMDHALRLTLGSSAVGIVCSVICVLCMRAAAGRPAVKVGSTVALTWISFWLAEDSGLRGSGILAVVVFSICFCLYGKSYIKSTSMPVLMNTWKTLAFGANTLLFFITGTVTYGEIYSLGFLGQGKMGERHHWWMLFALYACVHIVRAVSLTFAAPILKGSRYGFDRQRCILLWWSGLRGAMGLTLALQIFLDPSFSANQQKQVLFQVAGLVLLTHCMNAISTEWLYVALGFADFSEDDKRLQITLADQLHSLSMKRRERIKRLPLFQDVEYKQHFASMAQISQALKHEPSSVAKLFYFICPTWLQRMYPSYEDPTSREYWKMLLRAVLVSYDHMFARGRLTVNDHGVLTAVALDALERRGELNDSIDFQWRQLHQYVTTKRWTQPSDWLRTRSDYHRLMDSRFMMQAMPVFEHAHEQGIAGVKQFPDGAMYVEQMEAQLGATKLAMKEMYAQLSVSPDVEGPSGLGNRSPISSYAIHSPARPSPLDLGRPASPTSPLMAPNSPGSSERWRNTFSS